ncbi:NAD-dependent deacylase [Heliobacterium chlorum]|uniref:protein acetyllysine N-acetyltransferase n=1 Tax=Heliobacterium chlorum TaxID=2698 RepID=A0ABR7T4M7_HELCL|nr:NAD-dependent deacylase [Heliobacterium chlorum]MBC9784809.1 NAD-dependent deacylase [Heliobacterium chlorum]
MVESDRLDEIVQAWRDAENPVVFTGAGMSTASGLPDFRSARGLWKQQPESLATLTAMRKEPDEFYFFYQWRIARLWEVQPNDGHKRLVELERQGRVKTIITQNVDALHQRAGSQSVIELHGTLRTVSCVHCHARFESRQLLPKGEAWEAEYRAGLYRHGEECCCPKCGKMLRPDVVLFGESLPQDSWMKAVEWSRRSDFFVVIGSSLVVGPANLCPLWAAEGGGRLLIINAAPTPLDDKAAWIVREPASDVLKRIAEKMVP